MGAQPLVYRKLFEFDHPTKKPLFMPSEMEELRNHFNKLAVGQENIAAKVDMMEDSIKEVKTAIVGNPPMNTKGLAEQIKDLEDRMREYDRKGVMASAEKVNILEEKVRGYDKLLDRGWGAGKVVSFLWGLFGAGIGSAFIYIVTQYLKSKN
jgi:cell division protein FtsB